MTTTAPSRPRVPAARCAGCRRATRTRPRTRHSVNYDTTRAGRHARDAGEQLVHERQHAGVHRRRWLRGRHGQRLDDGHDQDLQRHEHVGHARPDAERHAGRRRATTRCPSATLADGTYTAQSQQTDAAGNTGFSSANTFTVDTVRPTVTVNQAAGQNDPTNQQPVNFTVDLQRAGHRLRRGRRDDRRDGAGHEGRHRHRRPERLQRRRLRLDGLAAPSPPSVGQDKATDAAGNLQHGVDLDRQHRHARPHEPDRHLDQPRRPDARRTPRRSSGRSRSASPSAASTRPTSASSTSRTRSRARGSSRSRRAARARPTRSPSPPAPATARCGSTWSTTTRSPTPSATSSAARATATATSPARRSSIDKTVPTVVSITRDDPNPTHCGDASTGRSRSARTSPA